MSLSIAAIVVGAARALEQRLARQQLPQHGAEREQVAALIDRLLADLLGRAIRELGGLRDPRRRQAEIEELDRAIARDHHVRRRQVAVDDVERGAVAVLALVRVVEAGHGTRGDGEDGAERDLQPALRLRVVDDRAQQLAVDVLDRDVVRAAEPADVGDLRDVRVAELGPDARLLEEGPRDVGVGGSRPGKPLEDEQAGCAPLAHPCQEHLAGAAIRQPREDMIAVLRHRPHCKPARGRLLVVGADTPPRPHRPRAGTCARRLRRLRRRLQRLPTGRQRRPAPDALD